jgi:hypothetical protein
VGGRTVVPRTEAQYGLGYFQTEKEHIVRIQETVALLTLVVSGAILRLFVDHARDRGDDCVFHAERWATAFRSYAQQVRSDIVVAFSYEPNLPDTWYLEDRQPAPSRRTLLEEVNAALYAGFTS